MTYNVFGGTLLLNLIQIQLQLTNNDLVVRVLICLDHICLRLMSY